MEDSLGNKAKHAEREHEEQDEGTGPAGLRLPRQFADDEKHVKHEGTKPEAHAKRGNLLFSQPENQRASVLAAGKIGRNAHTQGIELDEAAGIFLIVGTGIVLKRRDG